MQLNTGQKIISTEDIIVASGPHIGESLDDVLNTHDNKINTISSGQKFLYQVGGVGNGTGSNSGGGSSSNPGNWSIFSQLHFNGNSYRLKENPSTVNLHNQGTATIDIHINNANGDTFKVHLGKISDPVVGTCDINNAYTIELSRNLTQNGTITVIVSDSNGQINSVSINYTVSDYQLTSGYDLQDESSGNNEFTTFSIASQGYFNYNIKYSIATSVKSVEYELYNDYNNWSLSTTPDSPDYNSAKEINIPIVRNATNANNIQSTLGSRIHGKLVFNFTDGTSKEELIDTTFIIIPSGIFLIISMDSGQIYTTEQDIESDSIYKYNTGRIYFNMRVYEGIIGANPRKFNAVAYLYKKNSGNWTLLNGTNGDSFEPIERTNYSYYNSFDEDGEYKLHVVISDSNANSNTFDYYIYVKKALSNAFYYFKDESYTDGYYGSPLKQENSLIYFRGTDFYRADSLKSLVNRGVIEQSSLETAKTASLFSSDSSSSDSSNSNSDLLISIGLQYYSVNDNTSPFITIQTTNGNIELYQDKFIYLNSSNQKSIYIPKSSTGISDPKQYHLIQIAKRLRRQTSNTDYYSEVELFIDGIPEAVLNQFIAGFDYPTSITFNPANYYVNLVDVAMLKYQYGYQLQDSEIQMYFNKYVEEVLNQQGAKEDDIKLYTDCFKKTYSNGVWSYPIIQECNIPDDSGKYTNTGNFVKVTSSFIDKIKEDNPKLPIIIFSYEEKKNSSIPTLKQYLSTKYNQGTDFSNNKAIVGLKYSVGNLEFNSGDQIYNNYQFVIFPQGSTTLGYFGKNLTLGVRLITQESASQIAVFSPNFSTKDLVEKDSNNNDVVYMKASDTFLPEQEFNLKADAQDSSHTNNDAVGVFVNENTTKFNTPYNTGKFKDYIKNCLNGFATLVFINDIDENNNNNYYLLGVYNFNLGRKSYFNLGYKDSSVYENNPKLNDNGQFSLLTIEDPGIGQGIEVAEIQDNHPSHDFSQWQSSVLYKNSGEQNSENAMFGDIVGDNTKDNLQELVHRVSLAGGYIFKTLGKNFNNWTNGQNEGYTKNGVPNYMQQQERGGTQGDTYSDSSVKVDEATESSLTALLGSNDENNPTTAMLNYASVVEYYTICMAFGMVDSVQKNMNIKSFNNGKQFVAAFYDMDTSFGKNNEGGFIKYYAFSDYWEPIINSNEVLQEVKVWYDYGGESTSDVFDYPSSYLFAIAKYACIAALSGGDTTPYNINCTTPDGKSYTSPRSLWALWRRTDGPLRNAQYVFDTYWGNHLNRIPDSILSYNYRYKYLTYGCPYGQSSQDTQNNINSNMYDNTNVSMFTGSGKYRVLDWLNSRLHILDVYFGTSRGARTVYFAEKTDGSVSQAYQIPGLDDDITNPDIISRQSAFGTLNRLTSTPTISLKAKDYNITTFTSNNQDKGFYLFVNSNNTYKIQPNVFGSQQINFLGSKEWTWISDINFYTQSNSEAISITSDYLQNIKATAGNTAGIWTIKCPALKTIELDGQDISGTINLPKSDSENMPNLENIDVSNTKVSLIIENSSVKTINYSNVNAQNLTITNCSNLISVNLNNVTLSSSASLTYTWGSNLRISNTNIKQLKVTATKENSEFYLSTDNSITNITLIGFKKVTINNCSKLQKVTIQDSGTYKCEELYITNCNGAVANLGFNTTDDDNYKRLCKSGYAFSLNSSSITSTSSESTEQVDNIINLSKLHNLKKISFNGTKGFFKVINSDNNNGVSLIANSFSGTHMMYLNGGSFILQPQALQGAGLFTLRQDKDGSYTSMNANGVSDLSCMFMVNNSSMGVSTWSINDVNHVITLISDSTTDINRMFRGHTIDTSSFDSSTIDLVTHFKSLVESNRADIVLKNCSNVVNADGVLAETGYRLQVPAMFPDDFGSSNGVSIVAPITGEWIATTTNIFENIREKLIAVGFNGTGSYGDPINAWQGRGNVTLFANPSDIYSYELFKLKDIFSGCTKLETIHVLNIKDEQTCDLTDAFVDCTKLNTINWFFYKQGKVTNVDGLCKNISTSLNNFSGSFRFKVSSAVDIYSMFNWDAICNTTNPFGSEGISHDVSYESLIFSKDDGSSKYITQTHFTEILNKVVRSSTLNAFTNVFRDCNITDGSYIGIDDSTLVNSRITDISHLFQNLTGSGNILLQSDIFQSHLTGITTLYYTFAGIKFADNSKIPFNFFGKRQVTKDKVWVLPSSQTERIQATRTVYTYKNVMQCLYHTFDGCTFGTDNLMYDPSDSIESNNIKDDNGNYYTTYYNTQTSITENTLEENPEYTDFKKYDFSNLSDIIDTTGGYIKTNPNYQNTAVTNKINYCIPIDLFMAVNSPNDNFGNQGTFYNTGIVGILPQHLFNSCKGKVFDNCFYACNIIPAYVGTDRNGRKLYQFVPDNFTSVANLDRAFNFNMRIPQYNIDSSTNSEIISTSPWYIVATNKVSSQIQSLSNAFPIEVSTLFSTTSVRHNFYTEGYKGKYVVFASISDDIDSHTDESGNVIIDKVYPLVSPGIPKNIWNNFANFSRMYMQNTVETMYGETLLELNITSTSDLPINNGQFMYVGHSNNSSYFSAGITLPRFRNAQNKNFIYVEWNTTLSTSQLKSSEDADIYNNYENGYKIIIQ